MLAAYRKRIDREDEGFTLIELMVVVLIIAILLAIAIPTFLGARERAQDRAAQSDIRNALAAEKVFYTDEEVYTDNSSTPAPLTAIEPSLTYANSFTSSSTDVVAVTVASDSNQVVCISRRSAAGDTFMLADVATGANAGTYYFGTDVAVPAGGCTSVTAITGEKGGW
jgi:type IV pilus assembly protein PilA